MQSMPGLIRVSFAAAMAAVLVALAACGGDDDNGGGGGEPASSATPAETVDVKATDFKLTPADPAVDKTGTVKFRLTNDGEVGHALEVEGPNGEAETEQIPPGQSATVDVDLSKPGKYEMYCPVGNHKAMGMTGEITVAGGSGSSGGSTTEDKGDDKGGSGY
jgi:plastocyanin